MIVAGLILAGGEARRMGGIDKPLLRLGGIALLDRIIGRLRSQTAFLALSANGDASRFAACGLAVLADFEPGLGPLAGVLRGLHWARGLGAAALLTVPGDTPFIPEDLAVRLSPAPAVAAYAGRRHHAVALWPVECGSALAAHLHQAGSRSVVGFADRLGMRVVEFAQSPIGAAIDPFFNINTAEDLSRAELLLAGPSPRARTPG